MGKKNGNKKKIGPMLIVWEDGMIGTGEVQPPDAVFMLIKALVNFWNREMGEIDIGEAADKIVDLLIDMSEGNDDDDEYDDDDEDECEDDDDFGEEDLDDVEIRDGIDTEDIEDIIKIILGHKRRS
jgi:hypothetical protein